VTVAHLTEPVPRQWLADYANLQQFLSVELSHGVVRATDRLIVHGSEVEDAEVDGILSTSGVIAQPFVTDPLRSARRALTTLEVSGEEPTAYVFHPEDWEEIEQIRDGMQRFLIDGPQERPRRVLYDLPVTLSLDVDKGKGLLADWRTVSLLVREGVRVDWSEAGPDLFDKNLVKFRGEARVGLAITRPSAIAVISLNDEETP